jgi:hypothetical protein
MMRKKIMKLAIKRCPGAEIVVMSLSRRLAVSATVTMKIGKL